MQGPQTTSPSLFDAPDRRVKVLLPLPLAGSYDYRVPEGLELRDGDYVSVPLGQRRMIGVVWGTGDSEGVPAARLKDIEAVLPAPPLSESMRRFVDWVAGYTLSPPGAVLRMVLRSPEALQPAASKMAWALAATRPELRLTPSRRRVLALLEDGPPRITADLAHEAGVGPSVVKALATAGALVPVPVNVDALSEQPDAARAGAALSPVQAAVADRLRDRVGEHAFSVSLLDGVTGSGKTEVYFEAVAAALQAGRQVLVLLPEIALSAEWLRRFADRFGAPPVEWHSDVPQARRRTAWRAVAEGRARVVVGARSALFLPFPHLGLIVVDEEHDASYKQDDGVIYHARDMAVVRGHIEGVPVVLASATPSLETVANVEAGRYERLELPARHGGAELPAVGLIDLRRDPPPRGNWLAPPLVAAITETLAAGEQVLLFLNRRGYAPLTLCRTCGHRLECPHCTAWLVEHRLAGRLICHHCGFQSRLPRHCPACSAEDSFAACGPGVERLAEEVAILFPEARRAVFASDTVSGPASAAEFVRAMQAHEIDILVGTQIVAKGHNFPMLTLVGVVDADLGLGGGDLRAAERTYQLLHQVAGRAGRAERPGRVLLQTLDPQHPVMQALAAGDRDRFVAAEAEERRRGGWPPYGRLAAVIVSGPQEELVDRTAAALGRTAPRLQGVEVLGPAPAPISMLRGQHRRRLLLRAGRDVRVQPLLQGWLAQASIPASVRVRADVDPYSFL
ncbi:MAG: primosomal protein N' [Alphaproteobacteria bacterium]